ncbi:unnamed protein product [Ceutorhynchus assimilis]|uniref:Uncharacterized protein n=1 Tax=Ceutorhynchus assimilis TaxID=467358 RepID=A0A9N9QMF1_9CUCU|nr:unnamed protein product [Ceutorhynchus assimilis]
MKQDYDKLKTDLNDKDSYILRLQRGSRSFEDIAVDREEQLQKKIDSFIILNDKLKQDISQLRSENVSRQQVIKTREEQIKKKDLKITEITNKNIKLSNLIKNMESEAGTLAGKLKNVSVPRSKMQNCSILGEILDETINNSNDECFLHGHTECEVRIRVLKQEIDELNKTINNNVDSTGKIMQLETLIKSLEEENSKLQQKAREQQDKCTEIEELKTKMKTAEVIISQYSYSLQSKNDKTSKLRDELEALKNEFKNMTTTIRVLEIANRTYEEEIIELKGDNITHQGEQTKHESEAESKNNHKNPKNNKKQRKQYNNNNINKSNNNENKNNIDNEKSDELTETIQRMERELASQKKEQRRYEELLKKYQDLKIKFKECERKLDVLKNKNQSSKINMQRDARDREEKMKNKETHVGKDQLNDNVSNVIRVEEAERLRREIVDKTSSLIHNPCKISKTSHQGSA